MNEKKVELTREELAGECAEVIFEIVGEDCLEGLKLCAFSSLLINRIFDEKE